MQPDARTHAVEIVTIQLGASAGEIETLAALLAPDERARADRSPERARRTFVQTRAALRAALGAALGEAPETISLAYGEHDKPALARGGPPHFSVAHAGGLATIALARLWIGIDVEPLRSVPDRDALAARFFHPAELAELRSLPAAERDLAFLRCWTRKEAYAKATGGGMALALERCRVTLGPGDAPRIVAIEGDSAQAAAWTVQEADAAAGYVCALAYRGPAAPLRVLAASDERDRLGG